MKKKNIIIITIIVLFIIMLIPIKMQLKDGGSIEYKAILYKVTKVHRINPESSSGYEDGWEINILGLRVYNSIHFDSVSTLKIAKIENVSIDIYDISPTGATIIIRDINKKPYSYGQWYKIEKKMDGKWAEVKTLIDNYGFNEMAYIPNDNGEVKFVMDWTKLYGELPLGSYRILKQVDNKYISVEFAVIDENSSKKIEVVKTTNNKDIEFNEYLAKDNRKIYLADNLKEVYYYTNSNYKLTLKEHITTSDQVMDDSIKNLTDNMTFISSLDDGGTSIYKSEGHDITIIKCNTLSGNRDIFIGDYAMNYEQTMCK